MKRGIQEQIVNGTVFSSNLPILFSETAMVITRIFLVGGAMSTVKSPNDRFAMVQSAVFNEFELKVSTKVINLVFNMRLVQS